MHDGSTDGDVPRDVLKVKEQEKLDVTKAPDGSGHDGAYRKLADVQVRNDNKDYGETGLEIDWKNGENTVHFALDIQRGEGHLADRSEGYSVELGSNVALETTMRWIEKGMIGSIGKQT